MSDANVCPTCGGAIAADAPGGACPRCFLRAGFVTGSAPPPERLPTPAELAPLFPNLEIGELLGRGGMGVVYRARHKALDREVALKILPSFLAADRAFADRFQREARALAKLQHPNIVSVHDFGQTEGHFWLLMEYVDGVNIRQAMRAGHIAPKEALAIVPQICDALQYAHEHGVVHRDIKPENVLLDKAGHVKVADFGLAKLMQHGAADATLTGAGQVMGTPHYMAPEQVEHPTEVDHRADIYSLGVVFYEMLTGELPLGRFAAPSTKSAVDARIDEIVLRTLEKEREARYQHASEVRTDVGKLHDPLRPRKAGPRRARVDEVITLTRRYRPERTWAAVLGIAVLVVGTIAWFATEFEPEMLFVVLAGSVLIALSGFHRVDAADAVGRNPADEVHKKSRWPLWASVAIALLCGGPLVLFAGCLFTSPVDRAEVELVMPQNTSMARPESDRLLQEVRSLWTDLLAFHGTASVESLYAPGDWSAIQALPEPVRRERSRAGTLGLPLIEETTLPEPLAAYRPARVELGGLPGGGFFTSAVLRLQGNRSSIRAPLVYVTGTGNPVAGRRPAGWHFAMAQAEIDR